MVDDPKWQPYDRVLDSEGKPKKSRSLDVVVEGAKALKKSLPKELAHFKLLAGEEEDNGRPD